MISTKQRTIAPSAIAIAAVIVLFAAAPLAATQAQAGGWHHGWGWGHHGWGWGHHGWGWGHHGWHHGWGHHGWGV
ncbi:MAG: hypothetical protein WAK17_23300 [Candidatus Nitrosopolaris sp.]